MREISNIRLRAADAAAVAQLESEGLEPLAARVFAARGVERRADICPPLKSLPPPAQLPGLVPLAAALAEVCRSGELLCIVGDYDADGITATTIAYRCLRQLGANVRWYIPNRAREGYGLSPDIAKQQAEAGVRHLLTVDNGISAHTGIASAQQLGMRVYVTDHHQPDGKENRADHVVNPQLQPEQCAALSGLVGVGVAFYLMARLCRELASDWDIASCLDLVALGTIADCGEMDATNRALVAAGLSRIRAGNTCFGMKALIEQAKIPPRAVNSHTVGFRLAPRVNAAGRLASAQLAMDCLLAEDSAAARQFAREMNALNGRRLQLQDDMVAAAQAQIGGDCDGIVVHGKDWSPGIVGIVAGRLAQQCSRPVFAFYSENGMYWRGSGRSSAGINLVETLGAIAAAHPQVLANFGGHRQAAGATVNQDALPLFAKLFNEACARAGSQDAPQEVDALSAANLTAAAVAQLDSGVWGSGFPSPLYASEFLVVHRQTLRGGVRRLQLQEAGSDRVLDAVCFGNAALDADTISILYRAEMNAYSGNPQIIIEESIGAP